MQCQNYCYLAVSAPVESSLELQWAIAPWSGWQYWKTRYSYEAEAGRGGSLFFYKCICTSHEKSRQY